MIPSFSVHYRNPGHWDIYTQEEGRLFRIRGGPGKYNVYDEREKKKFDNIPPFKTVSACMTFICDELMHELIVAKGQDPIIIEAWNV